MATELASDQELKFQEQRTVLVRRVSSRLLGVLLLVIIALISFTFTPILGTSPPIMAPVVLLVGTIGGFVSIQRRIKTLAYDDLLLISESINYLLLAPFVGGILALVLFLLFLSGLVGGELFPEFARPVVPNETKKGLLLLFDYEGKNPTDYAKLLFWSFLGGYSERFVVDILGNFEKVDIKSK